MAASNGQDFTNNSGRPSSLDDSMAFNTGMSFQNALHSTPQRGPTSRDQYHGYHEPSMHDSDRDQDQSMSMSIEIGRGVKRGARDDFADDLSSNAPLSFGNENSMYDVLDTPPPRSQAGQRRSDGSLRKDAAVRRATESGKANNALKRSNSGAKPRAVSETAQQQKGSPQNTGTFNAFNVRGSRFTSSRQVSTNTHNASVPTRFTAQGGLEFSNQTATAISATYNTSQTNQSFLLPDLPNINELVLGVRKDGTPVAKRTSRSRFTSASYNPQTLSHIPVGEVAVPNDEKAIYASLQILKGRLTQLEMENSEAQKRAEMYETENINLRSKTNLDDRRPDSGLGSDDDTLSPQKSKLQASVQALQDHVSRYERKISNSELAIDRVTKERDSLIAQISQFYLRQEQLVEENESFREVQSNLVAENEELREEVMQSKNANLNVREELREEVMRLTNENLDMREQLERMKKLQANEKGGSSGKAFSATTEVSSKTDREEVDNIAGGPWNLAENKTKRENSVRNRKESRSTQQRDSDKMADASARAMASRIAREVQKLREEAASHTRAPREERSLSQRSGNLRSRSRSQRRRSNTMTERTTTRTSKRNFASPADVGASDIEMTASENGDNATSQKSSTTRAADHAQIERDITELSELDFNLAADLRRKLEDERRSNRAQRGQTQATAQDQDHTGQGHTVRSTTRQSLPRKSSMKDVTAGAEAVTDRFSIGGKTIEEFIRTAKTVRVQSPHSSDATFQPQQPEVTENEDASMLSNTSRRRRRTGSTEGMTSAFIIPDITIHASQSLELGKACIEHNTASCTACSGTTKVEIPTPVPVTDRELEDVTNATVRPAQSPAKALATVIKNLKDEITHLKMLKEAQNQAYNQHDPALSRHRRMAVKAELGRLMTLIDKRCDQVYALYDVLEGQKSQKPDASQEIDESIEIGRNAPADRADEDDFSGMESDELPWEGLSEAESDD